MIVDALPRGPNECDTRRRKAGGHVAPARVILRAAMSTGPVDTIQRLLEAFNRGDFAALDELDAAAEIQDETRIPGAGWNFGHQGAIDWAVKLWESFGRLSFDITNPVMTGDCVVVRWHATGRGKRSGVAVDMVGWCTFTLPLGKIRRVEFFADRDAALEAALVR
jgi:ketosteroid isomerase-like protein